MKINGIIWLRDVVDKIAYKHKVETYEVEETLSGKPKFRFVEKGHRPGENVYAAFGQSEAGRYLIVYFVHKIGLWTKRTFSALGDLTHVLDAIYGGAPKIYHHI